LSPNKSLRFRGVCEAKWHMWTSLQRCCPKGVPNKKYMQGLLGEVKKNDDVHKFFTDSNIEINDLSCLSLMQHLGLPTPLLDYTIDINIALAFAADGAKNNEDKSGTDGYCSLYYFDLVEEKDFSHSVQKILSIGIKTGAKMLTDHLKKYPNEPVDDSVLRNLGKYVQLRDLENLEFAFVEFQEVAPEVCTLDSQILNLTNPNLVKQKGGFAINQYNDKTPFEENWNMRTKERRYKLAKDMRPCIIQLPIKGIYTMQRMKCVDIRKDVILKWSKINSIELYDKSESIEELKHLLSEIKDGYDSLVIENE